MRTRIDMNEPQIQAIIEKMIGDIENIVNVTASDDYDPSGSEFYFNYPGEKYLWSIAQTAEGSYVLFFYPNAENRRSYLRFADDSLGSENKDYMKKLFSAVQKKQFGFDAVIKDILSQ